jgi:ribosomal protein S18 acetylase RimI-like enzyme
MRGCNPFKDAEALPAIRLRQMTLEDLPRVLDFFEEINPTKTRDQIANWTKPALKEWPRLCWVAVAERQLIGAITAELRHNVPFIEDLFVDAAYRRQGVGSQLLTRVLEELGRMDVPFVKVETGPSKWPLAQKFYYRHGFRVCGVEQDRFGLGPQGDSVVLKKQLK